MAIGSDHPESVVREKIKPCSGWKESRKGEASNIVGRTESLAAGKEDGDVVVDNIHHEDYVKSEIVLTGDNQVCYHNPYINYVVDSTREQQQ